MDSPRKVCPHCDGIGSVGAEDTDPAARSGATPPPDGLRRNQIIDALHALELARIGGQEPLAAVGCINLHEHEEEADAILAAAATPPAAPLGSPVEADHE